MIAWTYPDTFTADVLVVITVALLVAACAAAISTPLGVAYTTPARSRLIKVHTRVRMVGLLTVLYC
jgi:hypothetical protein